MALQVSADQSIRVFQVLRILFIECTEPLEQWNGLLEHFYLHRIPRQHSRTFISDVVLEIKASILEQKCVQNVKVKFTLEQATKPQRGNRGIALLFP
jgi:hypothetical protein